MPESAPKIEFPAVPAEVDATDTEDEVVSTAEITITPDSETTPSSETDEVEIITGPGAAKMVRWPLKVEIPTGKVILSFNDVAIEDTLGLIAQLTGKVVIPVSATSLRAKKNNSKK